ncbi:MAG: hypothetical protein CM1200mP29_04590 [Verrucomicrobiota bacterium]|nr:MAG: hypothetical protein CM1200mP29_04590 [Verrucomicrobiota bacterium]
MTPPRPAQLSGGEEEVTASDLKIGDVIRIRPATTSRLRENFQGPGLLNQANITGESLPVDKATGEEVFAGTTNLTGVLEVEVTRAGEDTTFGRVRDLIPFPPSKPSCPSCGSSISTWVITRRWCW